jgi:hypothetical protein
MLHYLPLCSNNLGSEVNSDHVERSKIRVVEDDRDGGCDSQLSVQDGGEREGSSGSQRPGAVQETRGKQDYHSKSDGGA